MADTYLPTGDDGFVIKQTDSTLDLQHFIDQYVSLRAEWDALSDNLKTVPDQETLDFWNVHHGIENSQAEQNIRDGAFQLYLKVKPIYEGGLLPTRFHDQYLQLEQFANP